MKKKKKKKMGDGKGDKNSHMYNRRCLHVADTMTTPAVNTSFSTAFDDETAAADGKKMGCHAAPALFTPCSETET